MLPELTQDEFSAALDDVAGDLIETLGATGPPMDMLALAAALELVVAWDAGQRGRGRTVRLGGLRGGRSQGSILLRPEPRPERLQWAVAHEIGENSAFRVFGRLGVDPRESPPGAREAVANQLAGRLLLPRIWFEDHARKLDWELPRLKALYSTASHELIARRMLDFSPRIAMTVFDQGQRTWRQTNLPGRLPPLLQVELVAWHVAHEQARASRERGAWCCVQAWPVHEPDWKREILRTCWQDAGFAEALE